MISRAPQGFRDTLVNVFASTPYTKDELSDTPVQDLVIRCPRLQCLSVSGEKLTNLSLTTIVGILPHIQRLEFRTSSVDFTTEPLELLVRDPKLASHLCHFTIGNVFDSDRGDWRTVFERVTRARQILVLKVQDKYSGLTTIWRKGKMDHKSGVEDLGEWQDWPADDSPPEELPVPYGFRIAGPGHGAITQDEIGDVIDSLPDTGSTSIMGGIFGGVIYHRLKAMAINNPAGPPPNKRGILSCDLPDSNELLYVYKRATTGRGLALPAVRDEVEDTTFCCMIGKEFGNVDLPGLAFQLANYLNGANMRHVHRQHIPEERWVDGEGNSYNALEVAAFDRGDGGVEMSDSDSDSDMPELLDENGNVIDDDGYRFEEVDSSDDDDDVPDLLDEDGHVVEESRFEEVFD